MSNDFRNVLFAIWVIIGIIIFGTIAFWRLEPWGLMDSLYFTVYTVTTVGYGNIVPSPENRLFATLFILICATVTLACIAVVGNWLISVVQKNSAQDAMRADNENLKEKLGFHGHEVEGHLDDIHGDLRDSIRKIRGPIFWLPRWQHPGHHGAVRQFFCMLRRPCRIRDDTCSHLRYD